MPETINKFKFKMGCDPEFNMIFQGRKLHAQNTMQKVLNGKAGFQSTGSGFNTAEGNIGWDGASTTAEIRTNPTDDLDVFTSSIKKIVEKLSKNFPGVEFSTLNEYAPIGGHIHLEVPKGIDPHSKTFTKQLDKFFPFLIPITLSENKISATVRIKTNYGAITDLRIDNKFNWPDGTSGYTIEIRCPTAEWTTSEKITRGTLAYLGTVWHELTSHAKSFTEATKKLPRTKEQIKAVHLLAMSNYEDGASPVLKEIKKHIKGFELYEQYKKEIDFILNPKEVVKEKKDCLYEATRGWGFAKEATKITKTEFMSEKAIQDNAAKENMDNKANPNYIVYNKDFKVDQFAGALNERIVAFGWKPENTYVLFGLRKGIPDIIARNRRGEYLLGESVIKTKGDLTNIDNTFKKLETKLSSAIGSPGKKIDVISEKIIDTKAKTILIGIPYDMRTKEDTRSMLSAIYDIESGKYKAKKIVADVTAKEAGIVEKAYAVKETTKDESDKYAIETGTSQAVTRIRDAWDSLGENETEAEDQICILTPGENACMTQIQGILEDPEYVEELGCNSDSTRMAWVIQRYNALSEIEKIAVIAHVNGLNTGGSATISCCDIPFMLSGKQIYLLKLMNAMKEGYAVYNTYSQAVYLLKTGDRIAYIDPGTCEYKDGELILEAVREKGIQSVRLVDNGVNMQIEISGRRSFRVDTIVAMNDEAFQTYYQSNRIQ